MPLIPKTDKRLLLIATGVLFLTGRLGAQTSLEERLQKLESEVGSLRKENQQLRTELGLEARTSQTVVKPAGHESVLSVGGLVQAQADFGDKGDARFANDNDRFYLRRARINLQGRFLEDFDFRVELELAGAAAARAQLTDGYINWNRLGYANVRAGQFKTPFGYEQLASDPRIFTIERTLVNDRLTAGRQIGIQLSGDLFAGKISYATGLFNGSGVNTSANDNDQFLWAGRISGVAWQGKLLGKETKWTLGANALSTRDDNLAGQPGEFGFDLVPGGAKDNTFAGHRQAGGLDTQFHAGPFDLWVEYLRARFQPLDRIPARRFDSDGWYAQATYFVVPKQLQGLLKYEVFDPNLGLANDRTRIWTLGANWFLKADDLKLQFNYLRSDSEGGSTQDGKLIVRLQAIF